MSETGSEQHVGARRGAWLKHSYGRLLESAVRVELARILPNLFGYHLLQLGAWDGENLLEGSRIQHRVIVGACTDADTSCRDLVADIDTLPIATDSVDVVLLPHALEFNDSPHDVLREVERVLVPEGHVVIVVFNPLSLWGLARLWLGRRRRAPWNGRFFTATRVKDWLALLGFDVVLSQSIFFRPPLRHEPMLQRLQFLERLGARWWPLLGAVTVLVGRKRVATLTPIKPRWRPRRSLVAAGLAEPTQRSFRRER
jgi:SAM-dependent methyltransferase